MIDNVEIGNVLFLDIETVSNQRHYEALDPVLQDLWKHKSKQILRKYDEELTDEEVANLYPARAGIFAEFGKIICISVGIVRRDKDTKELHVRLKSFASDDEAVVLADFCQLVNQHYNDPNKHFICGHNIKEFDIPYICRRLVINSLELPKALDLAGKKPWETKHLLDTLELWKFGDYKHYTSLKLLAAILGFPSPKDDIDGSEVGRVFWEENALPRISRYCEKDVLATVQLFLRYQRKPILREDQVTHV
ncbi:MAG: 3'-5' exonuclease [Saprospiraceae bacterium]